MCKMKGEKMKIFKRVIIVLLVCVFFIGSFQCSVSANTESSNNDKTSIEEEYNQSREKIKEARSSKKARSYSVSYPYVASRVDGKTIAYSNIKTPDYKTYKMGDGGQCMLIPIYAKSTGVMHLKYNVKGLSSGDAYVTVYSQKPIYESAVDMYYSSGGLDVSYTESVYENGQVNDYIGFSVKKGKTYYLVVELLSYSQSEIENFSFSSKAFIYTTQTRSLPKNTTVMASGYYADYGTATESIYYKISIPRSGYISVTLKEYEDKIYDGYITLYTSKKKKISKALPYRSNSGYYKAYFAVKKGTYYVRVTDCSGVKKGYYRYGIRYTYQAQNITNSYKKSKAKTIKRKHTIKNVVYNSNKTTTHWYKITVPKKGSKSNQIDIDTTKIKSIGGNIKVYTPGGGYYYGKFTKKYYGGGYINIGNKGKRKGKSTTLYIKVTIPAYSGGMYKIKYVK